ncbi:MAG: hypothetical protein OHK0029_23120 [Armatimonadaceae bacterium]
MKFSFRRHYLVMGLITALMLCGAMGCSNSQDAKPNDEQLAKENEMMNESMRRAYSGGGAPGQSASQSTGTAGGQAGPR